MIDRFFAHNLHIAVAGVVFGIVAGLYTSGKLRLQPGGTMRLTACTAAMAFAFCEIFVYAVAMASMFCAAVGIVWLYIRYRFGDEPSTTPANGNISTQSIPATSTAQQP